MFLCNHALAGFRWVGRERFRSHRVAVSKRCGVTIIESVVASLLLGLLFMGAFAMVTQATLMMRQARNHYIASTLCLARLERARDFDYSLLPLMVEAEPGVVVDQNGAVEPDGGYRRSTRVRVGWPSPGVTFMAVRVDIRDPRTGQFGVASESMSTMFTEYLLPPEEGG